MKKALRRYEDAAYSLARIVFGFLFACHGAQKLFGLLGGETTTTRMGFVAGIIEFFGGIFIGLGLLASWAAVVTCGEMAVTYYRVHVPKGFFPIQNGGEKAALFCLFFLYVIFRGSGSLSLDEVLRKARKQE